MPTPEVVISEAVLKQAAALAAQGATIKQIAERLGVSQFITKKMMANPDFKHWIKEIGDEALNNAKQIIRAKTSDLANEVTRVLKARLEEDDLEAVKIALKVIGFDQPQDTGKGDTTLVVNLPGVSEKAIVTEFRPVKETPENVDV